MSHPTDHAPLFLTTHWSVVLAARDGGTTDSRAALEGLCRGYWYPLYAYVRRAGHSAADAQDLTQEFFARLLEKDWLKAAQPQRGRFRTFLLVAMKRFMANEWHRATAQKRGGAICFVPLDPADAEQRYAAEPAIAPDEVFERRWAMTLLDRVLDHLCAEFAAAGKAADFELLQGWLTASRGEIPYADLAAQLGTSEGAARVAVHRLRKRFRDLFREAIAQTVQDDGIEAEMRHLASVLSRSA